MKTIHKISLGLLIAFGVSSSFGSLAHASILPYDKVMVTDVTATTAEVSYNPSSFLKLSSVVDPNTPQNGYFEYYKTNQYCIAIYPTPEYCLPKKTTLGKTTALLVDLTPNTSYTVTYKIDNTIRCITTPCPDNNVESTPTTFDTLPSVLPPAPTATITRNLRIGARGAEVVVLQDTLRARGYFTGTSSGYFGVMTLKAVKDFQRNEMRIAPTGFVGTQTRIALSSSTTTDARFEGTIEAVSTACFSDGECSVTIDGKKVVTTIGWSQAVVGSIKGTVNSIGDIETSKIGAKARVYAKKTAEGYTLYGNANYYIEVL